MERRLLAAAVFVSAAHAFGGCSAGEAATGSLADERGKDAASSVPSSRGAGGNHGSGASAEGGPDSSSPGVNGVQLLDGSVSGSVSGSLDGSLVLEDGGAPASSRDGAPEVTDGASATPLGGGGSGSLWQPDAATAAGPSVGGAFGGVNAGNGGASGIGGTHGATGGGAGGADASGLGGAIDAGAARGGGDAAGGGGAGHENAGGTTGMGGTGDGGAVAGASGTGGSAVGSGGGMEFGGAIGSGGAYGDGGANGMGGSAGVVGTGGAGGSLGTGGAGGSLGTGGAGAASDAGNDGSAGPVCRPFAAEYRSGTGSASYYEKNSGEVHCSYDLVAANKIAHVATGKGQYFAALSPDDYNAAAACGACIEVSRDDGRSVVATVVDRCDTCQTGRVSLSRPAFEQIGTTTEGWIGTGAGGSTGVVSWKYIACPTTENIVFRLKEPTNKYWNEILVEATRYPIAKLEVYLGGDWVAGVRQEYNDWLVGNGNMSPAPYAVRVTDIHGSTIETSLSLLGGDQSSGTQFPVCQ